MRFAAIADIHGNRWALEAVLADIERARIDAVVNLGDNLFGPLDVDGTAALLRRLDLPGVSGNQDRELLGGPHGPWLATLPFRLELPGMTLFHGTPQADDVYLLDTVHSDGVSPATAGEIAARLGPGSPHARYAILDDSAGAWRIERIEIPYDVESAAACALANDRQDWAHRLRTGRVPPK